MLHKEVGPGAIAAGLAVVVVVIALIVWSFFKPTHQTLSAEEEQKVNQRVREGYGAYGPTAGFQQPRGTSQPAGR